MRYQRPVAVRRRYFQSRQLARRHLGEEGRNIAALGDLEISGRKNTIQGVLGDVENVGSREGVELEVGGDECRLVSPLLRGLRFPGGCR